MNEVEMKAQDIFHKMMVRCEATIEEDHIRPELRNTFRLGFLEGFKAALLELA